MPVFMYRWDNGDLSFVAAPNKNRASWYLDEWGDTSDPKRLKQVKDFMVDFSLNKDGGFVLNEFSQYMDKALEDQYPLINAVRVRECDEQNLSKEELDRLMAEAVEQEKKRLW